ncbi:alpha/beta hydrolase-fold protein [Phycicoccus sp.]|uniref:alpha/beta hydrolase n=1 Tax=Phycicoccus sp. TaxID=1902410 RepID=UPI002CE5A0BE|nr:alpha/beta hydrolase-fold protein [Phycicoccus sp.]HMM94971.1 alpha/beta hydrolase-fold protein [Phycicoccus sp.]
MALTSGSLVAVVVALLLVVFVAAVLDLPRLRHRWASVTARGAKVAVVAALAVLVSALVLNDQYLFYVSWSDLAGSAPSGTTTTVGEASAVWGTAVAGAGLATLRVPATLPALPAPGRRRQTFSVASTSLGQRVQVVVELPPGYDPSSPRAYPVVLGLHGFPSTPLSYVQAGLLAAEEQQAAAGRLAQAVVVIPQINAPRTYDSECVDGGAGGPQVDTWLARELPRWVVEHFRVRTDRTSWAAVGYSFGGWCAASLAVRHPDVYGAFVSFQSYFRPDFGTTVAPAVPHLTGYDLVRLERRSPVAVAGWVETSKQDSLSYPSTVAFLRAARAPTALTAVVLQRGGHRESVWQPLMPRAFQWLGRSVPGFHP